MSSKGIDIRELALQVGVIAMETVNVGHTHNKSSAQRVQNKPQHYEYLIVLDFEATCWEIKVTRKPKNEIIEFATVLLHIPKREIVSSFREYVQPTENPILTPFCTSLTGIKQLTVNNASKIEDVLLSFDDWVQANTRRYNLNFCSYRQGNAAPCTFATWSDWDLGTCLKKECKRKGITREDYFHQWIDVRKTYVDLYKDKPMGLVGALRTLRMDFVGQEHSGIDDARNTAFLINRMVDDGVYLENTKEI